jgi:hypothetical protein
MTDRKKMEDNQPGMDQKRNIPNEDLQQTNRAAETGEQGRASFAPGSTTQGGSNYGQGSSQLGGDAYHQGDTKNVGSNYGNESGKLNESSGAPTGSEANQGKTEKGQLNESRDDIPHGQGAHVNEKESNAQEDYPGTMESENDKQERDII